MSVNFIRTRTTRTVNLRVPEMMYKQLTSGGKKFNPSIVRMWERFNIESVVRLSDIMGIFDTNEWKVMLYSFIDRYDTMDDVIMYNPALFVEALKIGFKSIPKDLRGEFKEFDITALCDKISALTFMQSASVVEWIKSFGLHGNIRDMEEVSEWANMHNAHSIEWF